MKKQIAIILTAGCASAFAASVNYDILGRRGSQMNSPMVYRNVDYNKINQDNRQKKGMFLDDSPVLKKEADFKPNTIALEGAYSTRAWNISDRLGSHYYLLGYERTTEPAPVTRTYLYQTKGYISEHQRHFMYPLRRYESMLSDADNHSYVNGNTYTTSNGYSCVVSPEPYTFGYHVQMSPYGDGQIIDYRQLPTIRELDLYSNRWTLNSWYGVQDNPNYGDYVSGKNYITDDWSYIGVYIPSYGLPVKMADGDQIKYREVGAKRYYHFPAHEMTISKAYKILKNSSKKTDVYIGSDNHYPSNDIDIELRVRASPYGARPTGTYYSNEAKELDNYIYDNRVVGIVAAGNARNRKFNKEAHAVNAITVGAVDPASGNPTAYSPNVNPRYCRSNSCNDDSPATAYTEGTPKPDVYNYSHFYFAYDKDRTYYSSNGSASLQIPYYDGTEMSAAYTAGMISDLMATNSFYRKHPEVVKALMLTSTLGLVPTYDRLLLLRGFTYGNPYLDSYLHAHDSRFWLGSVNASTQGGRKKFMVTDRNNGRKQIRFSVKNSDFPTNNFVAAIAWLSSGDDIAKLARIPQDFDLYACPNNVESTTNIDLNNCFTATNNDRTSFEKVSFSTEAEYITFVIELFSDNPDADNYGQIVLGFDVMSY